MCRWCESHHYTCTVSVRDRNHVDWWSTKLRTTGKNPHSPSRLFHTSPFLYQPLRIPLFTLPSSKKPETVITHERPHKKCRSARKWFAYLTQPLIVNIPALHESNMSNCCHKRIVLNANGSPTHRAIISVVLRFSAFTPWNISYWFQNCRDSDLKGQ